MLHTAWGELREVCVTGGCGEVNINSFNKGLNAFIENKSVNRC